MLGWVKVNGSQLRPGMQVFKTPTDKKPETLKSVTGECQKGYHFGSGCYDRIGEWWIRADN